MCNYYKRMVAAGEDVAEKIGVEGDAILILDEGESVLHGNLTLEEACMDAITDRYIEMRERQELENSLGVAIDMERGIERANAWVVAAAKRAMAKPTEGSDSIVGESSVKAFIC